MGGHFSEEGRKGWQHDVPNVRVDAAEGDAYWLATRNDRLLAERYTDYSACVADGIYSEDECEITFGPPPAPPPAPELGDQRNYTGCILEGLPEAECRDAFPGTAP